MGKALAIVSIDEDPQIIREVLSLGAVDYLPKSTSNSESALSIERVPSGASIPDNFLIQNEQQASRPRARQADMMLA